MIWESRGPELRWHLNSKAENPKQQPALPEIALRKVHIRMTTLYALQGKTSLCDHHENRAGWDCVLIVCVYCISYMCISVCVYIYIHAYIVHACMHALQQNSLTQQAGALAGLGDVLGTDEATTKEEELLLLPWLLSHT